MKGDADMAVVPTDDFLEEIARLTDDNHHGEVYRLIAKWGYDNCDACAVDETEWIHPVRPAEYFRNSFLMFMEVFEAMDKCHRANGDFAFCNARYEVGRELEDTIVRCFGRATLDAINERC